MFLLAYII